MLERPKLPAVQPGRRFKSLQGKINKEGAGLLHPAASRRRVGLCPLGAHSYGAGNSPVLLLGVRTESRSTAVCGVTLQRWALGSVPWENHLEGPSRPNRESGVNTSATDRRPHPPHVGLTPVRLPASPRRRGGPKAFPLRHPRRPEPS